MAANTKKVTLTALNEIGAGSRYIVTRLDGLLKIEIGDKSWRAGNIMTEKEVEQYMSLNKSVTKFAVLAPKA